MSRKKPAPEEPKTYAELNLECIEALCVLSIAASRLARMAYDGAEMLTEKMLAQVEEEK